MENTARRAPHGGESHAWTSARVDAVTARAKARAALEAANIRDLATLAQDAIAAGDQSGSRSSRERDMAMRSLAAELALATHQSDHTTQRQLSDAYSLVTCFPATVSALETGRIQMPHVGIIHRIGTRLPAEVREAWESVVLDFAADTTPGRTNAFATALAEKVDPRGMTDRFETANAMRAVSVIELDDGMALLQVRLPATLAYGIKDRIRRMAKQLKAEADAERARIAVDEAEAARRMAEDVLGGAAPDLPVSGAAEPFIADTRNADQIQADLVADLRLTAAPAIDPTLDRSPGGLGAIRAVVQVVVPVTTLTGTTDAGAMLNGQIPVDPATAKRLAGDAPGWDRVMCHPVTGSVLATDRYTPTADQVRFLRARDQHCRMPGCRQPAVRCDIDHNHEHQHGGRTDVCNLCHLCKRHHTLKTETEWTVEQTAGGVLHFTTPLGRHYREAPPPRVMFVPDTEPPPF
jgi:hypothetical protein